MILLVDNNSQSPSTPVSWDAFTVEYEQRVEPFTSQFAEELLQLLLGNSNIGNGKLLDVGCGTGAVTLLGLSQYELEVAATDISEAMVKRTKERGLEMIAITEAKEGSSLKTKMRQELLSQSTVANGMDLPDKWFEYFDFAAANFSVVFYADMVMGLREIKQCLLPCTGRVAFSAWGSIEETPGFRVFPDVANEVIPELVGLVKPRRINGSIDTLINAMQEAGFVDIQVVGPVGKTLQVASPSEYYNRFALTSPPTAAMIGRIKDDQTRKRFRQRIMEMAKERGGQTNGSIAMQSKAYLVFGRKPANEIW